MTDEKARKRSETFADHYSQARLFYRLDSAASELRFGRPPFTAVKIRMIVEPR